MPQVNVTANTSQAVGAMDALTAALERSERAFRKVASEMERSSQKNAFYAESINKGIHTAFEKLWGTMQTVYSWMERIGAGLQLVFNSLLKEIDKIQGFNAIMSVTTGTSGQAAEAFMFLRKTADSLGLQFDSLSSNYAKLVAAIPEGNDRMAMAERVFLGVASAARTLHASNQDTQLMFYAVTQIASKGVVSMEELRRQLGEKLPGALNIAAKGLNTTTEQLEKMIRKGLVDSIKFLPIFGDALVRTFYDSAQLAATSVSAALNRLTNVWVDFTKEVIDSGAGNAIIGVFDAMREKLSDPYVISRFASVVEYLSKRLTDFVQNLTEEDLRNGFDAFVRGAEAVTKALGGIITGITWIIDHSTEVGAVLGAMYGASKGFALGTAVAPVAGPLAPAIGMGVGAVTGLAAGAWGGSQLGPTDAEKTARMQASYDAKRASEALVAQRAESARLIEAILKLFNLTPQQVPGIEKPERLNNETVAKLRDIFTDKRFKTDAERADAARAVGKYGYAMEPATRTLDSVLLGNSEKERAAREKAAAIEANKMQARMLEGLGLKSDYIEDASRLDKLLKSGKYTQDQYNAAWERMLNQQPVMIEYKRKQGEQDKLEVEAMRERARMEKEYSDARQSFFDKTATDMRRLDASRASIGMNAKERFILTGTERFNEQAVDYKAKATTPEAKAEAMKEIDLLRRNLNENLSATYDEQTSAMSGLTMAYIDFFDVIKNRGANAADTFNNFVGGMKNAWTDFVMTGQVSIKGFVQIIQMEIAKVTWNKLIGPYAGGAASYLTGLFAMENGGIMTSQGALSLNRYAMGGIANSPQVAVYGEGSRPEAFVPLPDGRSIPVTMRGVGGGGDTVIVNQTVHVGQGVSRSEVASAMVTAKNAAVGEIRNNMARRRSV